MKLSAILFCIIVIILFVTRVAYFVNLPYGNGTRLLMFPGDQGYYHTMAQEAASGNWLIQSGDIQRGVGYIYFVGIVYRLSNCSDLLVRILQHLLGILTGCILMLIGKRLFGTWIGIIAGVLYAFYMPAVAFEGTMIPESLLTFCLTAGLWCYLKSLSDKKKRYAILSGLLYGYAFIIRPNNALFIVFLILYSMFTGVKPKQIVSFAVASSVFFACLVLRNYLAGGAVFSVSQQFQPVMLLGHYHTSDGIGASQDFQDAGAYTNPNSVGKLVFIKYLATDIAHHFFNWIKTQAFKIYVYFFGFEFSQFVRFSLLAESMPWIRVPLSAIRVIAPLCVTGIFMLCWVFRKRRFILLYFLVALLTTVLFYMESRFRYTAIPLFVLSGAYVLWTGGHIFAKFNWKRFVVFLLLLAGNLFLFNISSVGKYLEASLYTKQLLHWQNLYLIREDDALVDLLDYLELNKFTTNTDSKDFYFTCSRDEFMAEKPLAQKAALYIGMWYADRNDPITSVKYLNLASNLGEMSVLFLNYIGEYYKSMGNFREAVKYYDQSLKIKFNQTVIINNLAGCLFQLGRDDEALNLWLRNIKMNPQNPVAHFNIARYLFKVQRYDEARSHFMQAQQQGFPSEEISPYLEKMSQ